MCARVSSGYPTTWRALAPGNVPDSKSAMRVSAWIIDGGALNSLAEQFSEEASNTMACVGRGTLVEIILKGAPHSAHVLTRLEYFKRYDRFELDLDTSDEALHDPVLLRDLILESASVALTELGMVGHVSLPPKSVGSSICLLRKAKRAGGGVLLFTIGAKEGGIPLAQALRQIEEWVDNMGLMIDGEVDISAESLDVYIGSDRGVTRVARKFLKENFSQNSVIAMNTNDTVIAEWN